MDDLELTSREKQMFWTVCKKIAHKIGYGEFVIKCHDYKCQDIQVTSTMHAQKGSLDRRLAEAGLDFLSDIYS